MRMFRVKHMPYFADAPSPVFCFLNGGSPNNYFGPRRNLLPLFRFAVFDAFDLLGFGFFDQRFHRLVNLGLEAPGQ